jgi:hypothetical protein
MSLLAEGSASVPPADGSDWGTWRVCPSYAVDQLRCTACTCSVCAHSFSDLSPLSRKPLVGKKAKLGSPHQGHLRPSPESGYRIRDSRWAAAPDAHAGLD